MYFKKNHYLNLKNDLTQQQQQQKTLPPKNAVFLGGKRRFPFFSRNEFRENHLMENGVSKKKEEVAVKRMFKLMQKQHGTKGLRIDLQIKDPFSIQEIWVDVTCIHPTVKTRIQSELKQIKKEIIFEDDRRRGINNH